MRGGRCPKELSVCARRLTYAKRQVPQRVSVYARGILMRGGRCPKELSPHPSSYVVDW